MRGVLAPGARPLRGRLPPVHGFSSATTVHDVAEDDDGRELIVLYVGDFDPTGMFMSERDLPERLAKYGGDHVKLKRIALTREQVRGLPSFPAADKTQGPALPLVRHQLRQRVAGNSTRWTPTICATASSGRSRS